MNHTPGPWYADKIIDRNAYNVFPFGATHALVTVAAPAYDGAHPYGQSAAANARLIAAAPELLAALQALLAEDGVGLHSPGCVDTPPGFKGHCCPIARARAAIARATV